MIHLKLQITGTGEDLEYDKSVEYTLKIENENHKATIEFYDFADLFDEFAKQLEDFPFKNKEDVVLELGNRKEAPYLKLTVKLIDAMGRCELWVDTTDLERQSAKFFTEVEVADLQRLAQMFKSTDFRVKTVKEWVIANDDFEVSIAELMEAHKHCFKNVEEIRKSTMCGCFYCLYTFRPIEIEEWADEDETAICPSCMIDAVIGDASGVPLTQDFLKAMYKHYF